MRNPTSRPEPAPSGEAGNGAAESFFWTLLAGAQNREDLCHSFIALQCSMVPTAVQGLLVVEAEPDGGFSPAAAWPEQGADPERLAELCERAIEERCGMLLELAPDAGGGLRYGAAYPVLVDGRPRAVVAVEVTASSEAALTQVMHHLQWGGAWMETLVRRERGEAIENAFSRLRSAVDILAAVLSVDSFQESSMTFVTELATRLSCERVSIAFVRKGRSRIQAISHSARFGKRMNLIRAISQAMDEAVAQRKEVFFPRPPDGEMRIVRDHERLAQQHGAGAILTMPFFGENRYDGVVTLERPEDAPFSLQDAEFCRSVASLLLPTLLLKRQNDRNAFLRFWDDAKSQCVKLFGPRYPGRKLAVALAAALALFFYYQEGDYRISARTVLEGAVKRVVVAPFAGYVKEASVRAGDVVDAGALMCTLDDRDLRLQRLNWISKRAQYKKQYEEALAQYKRAEASIIKTQFEQAETELDLVESRLERVRILAPFDGLVLSGDLTQHLGGAVEKGEVLFEVAPLDAYRVILQVDERRIADVQAGQTGHMILSALPYERFEFVVEKITPIAAAEEGHNFFRVEAMLTSSSDRLRPGMEGVGKIFVERRRLISIWTRDAIEWVRLWAWSWWP